jgi:hypothetical protein
MRRPSEREREAMKATERLDEQGRLRPEHEASRRDGDPCNDCGEPSAWDEATGWYYHIDPNAEPCFLMGSGPGNAYTAPVPVFR